MPSSHVLIPEWLPITAGATFAAAMLGVIVAWWLRRFTSLSVRNLYVASALMVAACAGAVALGVAPALRVLVPVTACPVAGAAVGRRWRLADLGAGDDLRGHELARRWIWQVRPARAAGELVRVGGQGEVVRKLPWPADVAYAQMTADPQGPRLPLGEGLHVAVFGGSGSGKTTSAQVLAAGRVLDGAALLVVDGKGDRKDERWLRNLAAEAGRPFVLFDPRDPDTDRWNPLRGAVADVVARAVEPIQSTEPYYSDTLREHVGVVAELLHSSGLWPPSLPLLADAVRPERFPDLLRVCNAPTDLLERADAHASWVKSPEGKRALSGGARRISVVLGQAWRPVLAPRSTNGRTEAVAVNLVEAIRDRAVVLWRTYSDDQPDEAKAATVLALADIYAAAGEAGAPWTLMLDEFGGVIQVAGERAVGLLQRGRSHHGQVIVITQSSQDIEALSQMPGLLSSMSDNFRGFCIHRQTSPESRDWLAKLCGTRSLWQSTDAMAGHGSLHSGRGSRRRVREFRIGADVFGQLQDREAVIFTTLGPEPERARILRYELPEGDPERIGNGPQHRCESPVCSFLTIPTKASESADVGELADV